MTNKCTMKKRLKFYKCHVVAVSAINLLRTGSCCSRPDAICLCGILPRYNICTSQMTYDMVLASQFNIAEPARSIGKSTIFYEMTSDVCNIALDTHVLAYRVQTNLKLRLFLFNRMSIASCDCKSTVALLFMLRYSMKKKVFFSRDCFYSIPLLSCLPCTNHIRSHIHNSAHCTLLVSSAVFWNIHLYEDI